MDVVEICRFWGPPWGVLGGQISVEKGEVQRPFAIFCVSFGLWRLLAAMFGILTPLEPHFRQIWDRFRIILGIIFDIFS